MIYARRRRLLYNCGFRSLFPWNSTSSTNAEARSEPRRSRHHGDFPPSLPPGTHTHIHNIITSHSIRLYYLSVPALLLHCLLLVLIIGIWVTGSRRSAYPPLSAQYRFHTGQIIGALLSRLGRRDIVSISVVIYYLLHCPIGWGGGGGFPFNPLEFGILSSWEGTWAYWIII